MEFRHFSIEEVREGVFAALHKEGGGAYSNAGIVDLGDRVVVFDAFETLAAGKELYEAVRYLTQKRVTWLVISHKHADHWAGNQVFLNEAVILSTHHTRAGMLRWGAEMEALKEKPQEIKDQISELEEQLAHEENPIQRSTLERRLNRNRFLLADLPEFKFCPPFQTFDGEVTLHGSKRDVHLVTVGPAHTPQECYMYLPADRVIFTGDLAFFDSPPFIAEDCNLPGWLGQLDHFLQTDVETFIPGHGALGGKRELEFEKKYLVEMQNLVSEAISTGKTLQEVMKMNLPAEFLLWEKYYARQQNNLRSLYLYLTKNKKRRQTKPPGRK